MIASLAAMVLLAAATAWAMFSAGPLCRCGCGNPWRDHSPLRRF